MFQHDAEATRIYHRLACFTTGRNPSVGVVCTLWAGSFCSDPSSLVARPSLLRAFVALGQDPVLLGAVNALGQALSFPCAFSALNCTCALGTSALSFLCAFSAQGTSALSFLCAFSALGTPALSFPCAFSALGKALSSVHVQHSDIVYRVDIL